MTSICRHDDFDSGESRTQTDGRRDGAEEHLETVADDEIRESRQRQILCDAVTSNFRLNVTSSRTLMFAEHVTVDDRWFRRQMSKRKRLCLVDVEVEKSDQNFLLPKRANVVDSTTTTRRKTI